MNYNKICLALSTLLLSTSLFAQDQCNTTNECKNTFGSSATDCANSRSTESICMCSNLRCDSYGQPSISYTTIPAKIEAEDYLDAYDLSSGNNGGLESKNNVDTQATTDTGGGLNVGWIDSGEWLEYPINVASAGSYQIQLRVASTKNSGMLSLEVDGAIFGSTLNVPNTGAWQKWETITSAKQTLSSGKKMLRINMLGSGFNINWINIQKVEATTAPPVEPKPPVTGNTVLGKFNTSKDLLLAHFDQKPDLDDVHAVAALATMLRDSRFKNVKYHAVSGTIGTQTGRYINAPQLFNIAFGSNWSNASTNWNAAVNNVVQKALVTLNNGGDVWVQEAGQSDFTADLLREIKKANASIDLKKHFHVVQHSNWNESKTTPADLTYVKNNAQYNKIADGNVVGNGTPGFKTNSGTDWKRAKADVNAGDIWSEAQRVAAANNDSSGFNNTAIAAGGFDYSDCAENTWIFGFAGLKDSTQFFNTFLTAKTTTTTPPKTPDTPSTTGKTFVEQNGLVVVDLESTNFPSEWKLTTDANAFGGKFLNWTAADSFNTPAKGTISIPVHINNPGRYKFNMRSSIRHGTLTTEANDSWVRIQADKFYGFKDGHTVCAKNTPAERCTGSAPNGSSADGWFKVYRTGGQASAFIWSAYTSDKDAHSIYAEFNKVGKYSIEISGRSKDHGIDRVVLHRDGNSANNVSSSYATSEDRQETVQ